MTSTVPEYTEEQRTSVSFHLAGALSGTFIFEHYLKDPGEFDLSKLANSTMLHLVKTMPDVFLPELNKQRVKDLMQLYVSFADAAQYIKFDKLPAKVDDGLLMGVLLKLPKKEFLRLANYKRLERLANHRKLQLFEKYPEWVVTNLGMPKLSSIDIANIRSAADIDTYLSKNISAYKIRRGTWEKLLKYDRAKYVGLLWQSITKNKLTACEIRDLIYPDPQLIYGLTAENYQDTPLTAKQWLYVLVNIRKKIKLDESLVVALEEAVLMEVLAGSTASRQLKTAINTLRETLVSQAAIAENIQGEPDQISA